MIWQRSLASSAPIHQFHQLVVSELACSQKSSMQKEGQNETVSYRVFAGTWNVGGVAPPDDLDLDDWLDTKASPYDIYVLGFQETVPLNVRNVLGPIQRSAAMKWQLLIGDALNNRRRRSIDDGEDGRHHQGQDVFRCVISKQMVGIFVSVWMRSSIRRHVRHPGVCSVGAGVLGRLGNKVSSRVAPTHGRGRCTRRRRRTRSRRRLVA